MAAKWNIEKCFFFLIFCVVHVSDHDLSYCIRFIDLENVYLDTQIMYIRQLQPEIQPILRKNSRHFENPIWPPQSAWKKWKHWFSDSQGSQLSKNVQFSLSPKKSNENMIWNVANWTIWVSDVIRMHSVSSYCIKLGWGIYCIFTKSAR